MRPFESTRIDHLRDLFVMQIEDLYDAEKRLRKALPKFADSAVSSALSSMFQGHMRETQHHLERLEQIFQSLNKTPHRRTCAAMQGLIQEGKEMVSARGNDYVRDAGLIAAAQTFEHYEMAGYGTARSLARHIGLDPAAGLLQQSLDEIGAADQRLTQLAEQVINPQAANA